MYIDTNSADWYDSEKYGMFVWWQFIPKKIFQFTLIYAKFNVL